MRSKKLFFFIALVVAGSVLLSTNLFLTKKEKRLDIPQRIERPPRPQKSDLCALIARHLDIPLEQVVDEATLASLGADDLDFAKILMSIEDKYEIMISDTDLARVAGKNDSNLGFKSLTVKSFLDIVATAKASIPDAGFNGVRSYSEIPKGEWREDETLLFAPGLGTVLSMRESHLKRPLSEKEVLALRDNASCIVTPKFVVQELEESRGFKDINPTNCWAEWQQRRKEFADRMTKTEP